MRWETYEAIADTLEILSDEALLREFRNGIQDLAAGKLVGLEDYISESNV